jgi:hypothetical protein
MLPEDVLIIDDFYTKPERIRELALNAEYNHFKDLSNFPGAESKKSFFSANHVKRFEELLNRRVYFDPDKYIFGKFRFATHQDEARTCVHLDWNVDWTAVIYLSLTEHCRGGLGLFKHRETGLTKLPTSEELLTYNCTSVSEFDKRYIIPVTKDLSKWELIIEIPIKFNRLVLFRGSNYFHGITEQFGDSLENSRLTQNFFFNDG